jgi:hypothetical protein
MALDFRIASACITTDAAGASQNIVSTCGPGTPPIAHFSFITNNTASGVSANDWKTGFGAATASDQQWTFFAVSQDNQATTNVDSRTETSETIQIMTAGAAVVDGEANHEAFVDDGHTIRVGNNFASNYLIHSALFWGDDAFAGNVTLDTTQNASVVVTSPSFQSYVVIAVANLNLTGDGDGTTSWWGGMGMAVTDGTSVSQMGTVARQLTNGQATAHNDGQLSDEAILGVADTNGDVDWQLEISDFTASGFTVKTASGGISGTTDMYFLALGTGACYWLGAQLSASATGEETYTQPGIELQGLLALQTNYSASNTARKNSSEAGPLGWGGADGNSEFSIAGQTEENNTTSNTATMSDLRFRNFPDDDGAAHLESDTVTFPATGWTETWDVIDATPRYSVYLGVKAVAGVTTASVTHVTDLVIKREADSQTHVTDLVIKREADSQTHVTDLVVERQDATQTHVTDLVVKREAATATHVTDLVVKREADSQTHVTDLVVERQDATQTHVTDLVVKREAATQTHVTDLVVKREADSQTHVTDLVIKREADSQTHVTDLVVERQDATQTHVTDLVVKREAATATHVTDLVVAQINQVSHITDLIIKREAATQTHVTDLVVKRQAATATHVTDLVLSSTATTDAFIIVLEGEINNTPSLAGEINNTPSLAGEISDMPSLAGEINNTPSLAGQVNMIRVLEGETA